jgi:hypothetical protein
MVFRKNRVIIILGEKGIERVDGIHHNQSNDLKRSPEYGTSGH